MILMLILLYLSNIIFLHDTHIYWGSLKFIGIIDGTLWIKIQNQILCK